MINNISVFSSCVKSSGSLENYYSIIQWIKTLKNKTNVKIIKTSLESSSQWCYDSKKGIIHNNDNSFFQVSGLRANVDDLMQIEQPILLQNEIGFLGIICKMINGVLHFLMQAKIEPGNINCVQISPTVQATKSNFTQKHGGKKPKYLEYFLDAKKNQILFDQIQSEQSSRFLAKRNRNIIILVDDDVPESGSHMWMTLYQIKRLMKIPNLVNMDTRTVLSSLPIISGNGADAEPYFTDKALFRSMFYEGPSESPEIYHYFNNYKMFHDYKRKLVPLYSLRDWEYNHNNEFACKHPYSFKLIHCDIEIEGREVKHWDQPLFEATGRAMFGLLTCVDSGVRKFLVKAKPEIGAFDMIELGPSVQREAFSDESEDAVYKVFMNKLSNRDRVIFDNVLSEEGGRFYHEENNNVIIEIDKEELTYLPDGYFWMTFRTLNSLIQINNTVNIQLRNMLSLLEL